MFRFKSINTLGSGDLVCTSDTSQIVGDYVVDDSAFVPLKEAVKNVNAGAISPQMARTMYDFPDGKDDGSKVPVDRTHSFSGDIAEVATIARDSADSVREDFKEYLKDKAITDRLNSISGSSSEQPAE